MLIRKQFKFEMGHIVRDAWSRRCSMNIHGHSYLLELMLKGYDPDAGQMLVDFGLVKHWLNDFVDSFDHTCVLWNRHEDEHIVRFFTENFERVICTPFSSSAEMQAKMFAEVSDIIIKSKWEKENGKDVNYASANTVVDSARVHETKTGWADYRVHNELDAMPKTLYPIEIFDQSADGLQRVIDNKNTHIMISSQIQKEWKNPDWYLDYNSALENV